MREFPYNFDEKKNFELFLFRVFPPSLSPLNIGAGQRVKFWSTESVLSDTFLPHLFNFLCCQDSISAGMSNWRPAGQMRPHCKGFFLQKYLESCMRPAARSLFMPALRHQQFAALLFLYSSEWLVEWRKKKEITENSIEKFEEERKNSILFTQIFFTSVFSIKTPACLHYLAPL